MILVILILIVILLVGTFFSPLITMFVAQVSLMILSYFKKNAIENWFLFICFSLIFVISLSNFNNSFHLFYHPGHDFPSYYNNYLKILENAPFKDWFAYGGGIEVSLPIVNYLISLVVDNNSPYPVFYLHSMLQAFLLVILCLVIKRSESLTINQAIILLVFLFCFYRFYAGMNALRQGYASFFILFALFSFRRETKALFILIACSFHITSIAIYFLCKYLLRVNSKNIFSVLTYFTLLSIAGVAISALAYFYDFQIIKKKLMFLLLNFNVDVIKASIVNGVKIGFLYFILFLHALACKSRDNAIKFLLYTFLIVTLSIHPTLFRFLFPLANILIGYYFYTAVFSMRGRKRLEIYYVAFVLCALSSILLYNNSRYHYSFDIITTPYKLFDNFNEKMNSVDRMTL